MRTWMARPMRRWANILDPSACGGYISYPIKFGNQDSKPEIVIDSKRLTDAVMRNVMRRI